MEHFAVLSAGQKCDKSPETSASVAVGTLRFIHPPRSQMFPLTDGTSGVLVPTQPSVWEAQTKEEIEDGRINPEASEASSILKAPNKAQVDVGKLPLSQPPPRPPEQQGQIPRGPPRRVNQIGIFSGAHEGFKYKLWIRHKFAAL